MIFCYGGYMLCFSCGFVFFWTLCFSFCFFNLVGCVVNVINWVCLVLSWGCGLAWFGLAVSLFDQKHNLLTHAKNSSKKDKHVLKEKQLNMVNWFLLIENIMFVIKSTIHIIEESLRPLIPAFKSAPPPPPVWNCSKQRLDRLFLALKMTSERPSAFGTFENGTTYHFHFLHFFAEMVLWLFYFWTFFLGNHFWEQ